MTDLMEEARRIVAEIDRRGVDVDPEVSIIARALAAAEQRGMERAARIVEQNMLCGDDVNEVLLPRTNPGNKVGLAYAAAIRRGEP